jgi:phage terminase Nu1 subunit (DNA packaging protein)
MKIDSATVDKINQANLANILKKVKAGKVLTAAERKLIEGSTEQSSELVTQKKIIEIFNITRKSIAQWRREGKEGVPAKEHGMENLTKWREFFASNPDAGFFDGKPRQDRESLLCEKLTIEIECKKLELKKLEESTIDMVDVQNAFYKLGSVIRAGLLRMQADLPPALEGQSPSRMAKIIGEAAETLLNELSEREAELWNDDN